MASLKCNRTTGSQAMLPSSHHQPCRRVSPVKAGVHGARRASGGSVCCEPQSMHKHKRIHSPITQALRILYKMHNQTTVLEAMMHVKHTN
jgi:hypothetical protein